MQHRSLTASAAPPWPALTFAALAVAFWWLEAPYRGIVHDAVFYAAEAQQRIAPGLLAHDLFFAYGSQGDYSLFIPVYAALARLLGLPWAALTLTALLRGLWLAGVWSMLRRLADRQAGGLATAAWAMGVVCLVSRYYEPAGLLSFAEPFATPRLAAEGLSLLAAAQLAMGRRGACVALALAGAALHPLIGWPMLAVGLLAVLAQRADGRLHLRRAAGLAALVLLAMALAAAAGLPMANRLAQFYDPAWWDVVVERNAMTVAQAWTPEGVAGALCTVVLLALASRGLTGAPALLAQAAAFVAGLAVAVWLLASSLHQVLFVQLQLWRALWLAQVLAAGLWAWRLAAGRLRTPADRVLALLLVAVLLCQNFAVVVLTGLVALRLCLPARVDARLSLPRQQALAAALLATLGAANLGALWQAGWQGHWVNRPPWPVATALAQSGAAKLLLCALGAWGVAQAVARKARSGGPQAPDGSGPAGRAPLAIGLWLGGWTACCMAGWFVLGARQVHPIEAWMLGLREHIPQGASVYWDYPAEDTWLRLQRPAWVTAQQGASALFYRDMAIEWQRRVDRVRAIGREVGIPHSGLKRASAPLDGPRALLLCEDPTLDFVIAYGRLPGADGQLPGPKPLTLSLFDCRLHRPGSAAAGHPAPSS